MKSAPSAQTPSPSLLQELGQLWRKRLHLHLEEQRERFNAQPKPKLLLKQHRAFIDYMLYSCWRSCDLDPSVALIAVGGYGRGELFPHSDIDLLILLPHAENTVINAQVEAIVGLFWDVGLAIGHSVRTLEECVDEAQKDVTVQTTLIEARLIAGNQSLFQAFQHQTQATINPIAFVEAKLKEQQIRHARFNDTAYNLEPNVKESPGGLRDLQVILWLTRALNLGKSWTDLAKAGFISNQEAHTIARHEQWLQLLRIRLHLLGNRREDRLIFDFQNELAAQLGWVNDHKKRASEKLMSSFYRSAKAIILFNEMLVQILQEQLSHKTPVRVDIHPAFQLNNGLLEVKSEAVFEKQPSTILEIFVLLAKHTEIRGLSAQLLRIIHRLKPLVNREFRQKPEHKRLFMDIIKQPQGVTRALRRMNRYGILGLYLPSFGRIVGQMQHDLFHVYTVDEHILNVLGNLRRFAVAEHQHEFPLCSRLMAEFDKPHLLFLAALFHDIAKGRGGDHSELGTRDAQRFCKAHGLSKVDTELVAWLVEAHLKMSSVAQKSDLTDPEVIEAFAIEVGTERRLIALYLLTVADIRGTSPKVWNAWKAKLLEHLFVATRRLLQGTVGNTETSLKSRQRRANHRLSHYGILEKDYQSFWAKLGSSYFSRHDSQEIAWHTRLLLTHIETNDTIVRARLSPGGDGIQALIYTKDRDDLFANICGFFERMGYTILEAKVHTTKHAYALDSFLVMDQSDKSVVYRDLLNYIEFELTGLLQRQQRPEPPLKGRLSRQVKHMPIKTHITLIKEPKSQQHQLSITTGDRPGLLSGLAHVFLQHHVQLHTAKINTLGNRAEDVFLISNKQGESLTNDEVKALEAAISLLFK